MSRTDLQARLIEALAPSAANRHRVTKYVARIAADLEDDRMLFGIVLAAEDRLIVTTEFVE
jgi:hypothetical protein